MIASVASPRGPWLDRRTLLGVTGLSVAGFGARTATGTARAATGPAGRIARIDAYTHFIPPDVLDYLEKQEAKPFPMRGLLMRKPTMIDVNERLALLDRNEVDVHVLVPPVWLPMFPRIAADRTAAIEAAQRVNDGLAAVTAKHPKRFRGVAMLPTNDPEAMTDELRRAVSRLGFVGGFVPVGPTAKRMDHPDFDAVYRTLVELDAALWLHPSRPPLPEYADEKVSRFAEWQTIGWLSDTTSAMYRIVFSGVFDRHPGIRIIAHHHGALAAIFAQRMEASWAIFEQAGTSFGADLSKPYIQHFRKFYCDTAAFGYAPKVLELALDFFGPERVLFGTDSPFDVQNGQYFTAETLRSIDAMNIAPDLRAAVLAGNAARTLKIG